MIEPKHDPVHPHPVRSWAPAGHEDGRSISMALNWGGHKLLLGCVYLPNDAVGRATFLEQRIMPMQKVAADSGRQLVLGGDFNFVHNPSLDRLCTVSGVVQRPTATTETTANVWASRGDLSELVDVYRAIHPNARWMSWMARGSAARLDRIYTTGYLAQLSQCPAELPKKCLGRAFHKSDHTPVVCHISRRSRCASDPAGAARGPHRTPRLNVSFMKDPELSQEFAEWLEGKLGAMPTGDTQRLKWWMKFKKKVLRWKIYSLNKLFFQRCKEQMSLKELQDELSELITQVNGDDLEVAAAAVHKIPLVKEALGRAEATLENFRQVCTRRAWIHQKERPSKALSGALQQRKQEEITALQDASGVTQTSARRCANVVIDFWAHVSAVPATEEGARTQVLAALNDDVTRKVSSEEAEHLGSSTITTEEILSTLRKCSPHTAAGPDGVPMKLYKGFKGQFAPMLAAIFTAFGSLRQVPRRFLDSIITILHKKGNRLDAGNYRPISLTSTDYRILARVLAMRLNPVLQEVIDPAQTAFLQGRHIGDNAMLLQFLGPWLQQEGRLAFVAFCDFRKAYDTIDRRFLFQVAETLGLGSGFLAWMKLLLTDTRSAAIIDGYLSDFRRFEAGVRQGCPLAPLLYLLVSQAALSWLKSQGIGIQVDSHFITAAQFADDLKVLLNGADQIPHFISTMQTFAAASGQHMLPSKTHLLPLGQPPAEPLPATLHGLPVASSVKALGLTFSQFSGAVAVNWNSMIESVRERIDKIVNCKLSLFGRAFAVNGYALSRFLFHSQFVGLPEGPRKSELFNLAAAAVDRKLCLRPRGVPGPSQQRFAGIKRDILQGHPKSGGIGLLPLEEHVNARLIWWACRLLTASVTIPWVAIGRAVLTRLISGSQWGFYGIPALQPSYPAARLHFLAAAGNNLDEYFRLSSGSWPQVLQRLASALGTLPKPTLQGILPAGPWCASIPLWSNPLMLDSAGFAMERGETDLQLVMGAEMSTLGDLVRSRAELEQLGPQGLLLNIHNLLYPYRPASCPLSAIPYRIFRCFRRHEDIQRILDLAIIEVTRHVPAAWIQAAQESDQSPEAAEDILLSGIGWKLDDKTYTLSSLTVKAGTLLQKPRGQGPHFLEIQKFANLVPGNTPPSEVQQMLARLWKLPCDGRVLASMWRLVLNGIPSAERISTWESKKCGCDGCTGPGRGHLYFDCPILQPLLESVTQQFLGDWALPQALEKKHIWLAVKPHPQLHQRIWDIVAVYLVHSFDDARKNWTDRALKFERGQSRPQRSSRTNGSRHRPPTAPGVQMISSVSTVILSEFWGGLTEFLSLHTLPSSWLEKVPLDHPFIRPDPERRTWVLSQIHS